MITNRILTGAFGAVLISACIALPGYSQTGIFRSFDVKGLQVSEGLALDLNRPQKTTEFRRISYSGRSLSEVGQPLAKVDATNKFANEDKDSAGATDDTPKFKLDLSQGTGTASGGLFDVLGINSFLIPKLQLGSLRGVSRVSGTLDGKQFNAAWGLETPAFHLTDIGLNRARTVANWLVFGVNGEEQWSKTATRKSQTVGIATYRGFIGKAMGWKTAKFSNMRFSLEDVLTAVPDITALKAWKPDASTKMNSFITLRKSLIQASIDEGSPLDSANAYRAFIAGGYHAYDIGQRQQPTNAIWIESAGQYTATGDLNGPRWRPLVAAVMTMWQDLSLTSRSSIQLRYENGFDRGNPTLRINRVIATVGLNF